MLHLSDINKLHKSTFIALVLSIAILLQFGPKFYSTNVQASKPAAKSTLTKKLEASSAVKDLIRTIINETNANRMVWFSIGDNGLWYSAFNNIKVMLRRLDYRNAMERILYVKVREKAWVAMDLTQAQADSVYNALKLKVSGELE